MVCTSPENAVWMYNQEMLKLLPLAAKTKIPHQTSILFLPSLFLAGTPDLHDLSKWNFLVSTERAMLDVTECNQQAWSKWTYIMWLSCFHILKCKYRKLNREGTKVCKPLARKECKKSVRMPYWKRLEKLIFLKEIVSPRDLFSFLLVT